MKYIGQKMSEDDLNTHGIHITCSREGGVIRFHFAIGKQYLLLNYKDKDKLFEHMRNYIEFESNHEQVEIKRCIDTLDKYFRESDDERDGVYFGFDSLK